MINWTTVAIGVMKDYGLYGLSLVLIFALLVYLIKYQEKRYLIADEKHREDWKEVHANHRADRDKDRAEHRSDRDEWMKDMKTVQSTCLAEVVNIGESSNKVINANTQALKVLSVRIENCTK